MSMQARIEAKLTDALAPSTFKVVNESHSHSVPDNSETHFKVTLVSDAFTGLPKVRRHQRVYEILAEELAGGVHALALHLFTEDEWREAQGAVPASPNCMGGSKRDPARN